MNSGDGKGLGGSTSIPGTLGSCTCVLQEGYYKEIILKPFELMQEDRFKNFKHFGKLGSLYV